MVSFKEVFRYAYIDTLLTCSVSLCFCTIKPIYLLPETGSVSKLTIIHSKILMCRLVEWKTNTIGPSHAPTHTVSSCSFAHLHRIHVFGTPDSWEEYLMFLRNSGVECVFVWCSTACEPWTMTCNCPIHACSPLYMFVSHPRYRIHGHFSAVEWKHKFISIDDCTSFNWWFSLCAGTIF